MPLCTRALSVTAILIALISALSLAHATDPIENSARLALRSLAINGEGPLYEKLVVELIQENDFQRLVREGDEKAYRGFARYILLSELEAALGDPAYPGASARALYPFVIRESQITSPPPPSPVFQFRDRFGPILKRDPLLFLELGKHGLDEGPSENDFWHRITQESPHDQLKLFREAAPYYGQDPEFQSLVQRWFKPIAESPLKHAERFVMAFDGLTPHLSEALAPLLFDSVDRMFKSSRTATNFLNFNAGKQKRMLTILSEKAAMLPPRERFAFILVQANQWSIHRNLARTFLYDPYSRDKDRLADAFYENALVASWLEENPVKVGSTAETVINTYRARMQDTVNGRFRPIGIRVFRDLIHHHPELAEQFAPYFFRLELFPQLIGSSVRLGALHSTRDPLLRELGNVAAVDEILTYLARSSLNDLKREFREFVSTAPELLRQTYGYKAWKAQFSTLFDPESVEGRRFHFMTTNSYSLLENSNSRAATYEFFRELLRDRSAFHSFLEQDETLAKFLKEINPVFFIQEDPPLFGELLQASLESRSRLQDVALTIRLSQHLKEYLISPVVPEKDARNLILALDQRIQTLSETVSPKNYGLLVQAHEAFNAWLRAQNLRWCARIRWPISCQELIQPPALLTHNELVQLATQCERMKSFLERQNLN